MINFVKMLFSGVCFVFMYLFAYVIVKSNDCGSNLFVCEHGYGDG